jgi:hypothetical protein
MERGGDPVPGLTRDLAPPMDSLLGSKERPRIKSGAGSRIKSGAGSRLGGRGGVTFQRTSLCRRAA